MLQFSPSTWVGLFLVHGVKELRFLRFLLLESSNVTFLFSRFKITSTRNAKKVLTEKCREKDLVTNRRESALGEESRWGAHRELFRHTHTHTHPPFHFDFSNGWFLWEVSWLGAKYSLLKLDGILTAPGSGRHPHLFKSHFPLWAPFPRGSRAVTCS